MKHLLNNISEEEKNSILEQHKGGMKIFNENFNKMVNKKLGHVELFEQQQSRIGDGENFRRSKGIELTIINTPEDLEKWVTVNRPDLAFNELSKSKLGFKEGNEMEKRMNIFLRDLMLFIAQKCDKPGRCAETVRTSNIVDVFIKNKKTILDQMGISPDYPQNLKDYLANQIKGKVDAMVNQA